MNETGHGPGMITDSADYDAVVVGASLAGCSAAMLLARSGARVALVDKQSDRQAFKRVCSHFIQASAVPTLERLGVLEEIMAAGGVRSRIRAWTPWGWLDPPPERAGYAVNLRREVLDPLIREAASATPGVDLLLGQAAERLQRPDDSTRALVVKSPDGTEATLRARLVVGADGRDSRTAEQAGIATRTLPHGRIAYGAYFEGAPPDGAPDGSLWMMDPQWAAAFPTDSGLVFYAVMPTKDRLPEFKRDPEAALVSFLADIPEPPPIRAARRVGPVVGKLDMSIRVRRAGAPGVALVGDAALATDPLFGVGCGWALQTGEWLADAVAPALNGAGSLERGLARYRRRHARTLGPHAHLIHNYATGRRFNAGERFLIASAVRDPMIAASFDEFATRRIGPGRLFASVLPRSLAVSARHTLGRRPSAGAAIGETVGG